MSQPNYARRAKSYLFMRVFDVRKRTLSASFVARLVAAPSRQANFR